MCWMFMSRGWGSGEHVVRDVVRCGAGVLPKWLVFGETVWGMEELGWEGVFNEKMGLISGSNTMRTFVLDCKELWQRLQTRIYPGMRLMVTEPVRWKGSAHSE
jgi:hypothetical protein